MQPAPDSHERLALRASTDDTRCVLNLLSALLTSRDMDGKRQGPGPHAWCEVSGQGIDITAVDRSTLQGTAHLGAGMFEEFEVDEEPLSFGINLGHLLNCVKLLGADAANRPDKLARMTLCYRVSHSPCMVLHLVEGNTVTECEVRALELDPPEPRALEGELLARVVWKAERLKEAIGLLEQGSSDGAAKDRILRLQVGPAPPSLSLTVSSTAVGAEMSFPANALVKFDATGPVDFTYHFSLVASALRSLKDAEEVLLRVSEEGTMHWMIKIVDIRDGSHFVDFFLDPLDVGDDLAGDEQQPQPCSTSNGKRSGDEAFADEGPPTDSVRRRLQPMMDGQEGV